MVQTGRGVADKKGMTDSVVWVVWDNKLKVRR